MSFYPNVDPNYVFPRNPDQYILLVQTKVVKYGKVVLKEIPSHTHEFKVLKSNDSLMTKVETDPAIENEYKVDFVTGNVFFHSSMENQEVEISYTGIGQVNFGANRIMLDTSATNEEGLTVQELLDTQGNISARLTDVETEIANIESSITNNQVVKNVNYQSDMTTLNAQLATLSQETASKVDAEYVDQQVSSIGQLRVSGVYSTLSNLQTAFPSGDTGVYIITSDGHWYYWNSSAWTDGGIFQSTEWLNALTTQNATWSVV